MPLIKSYLSLLLVLPLGAFAQTRKQECFDTAFEAIGYTVWAGDDPESYYNSTCTYPPKVLSVYAAATKYCKPEQLPAGIELLRSYCKDYGPDLELLPISDFAAELTEEAINSLPVVTYEEATNATDPYSEPILISEDFFDRMYDTVDDWIFEMWSHHTYGFVLSLTLNTH
jgi:hypothetical protein